MGWFSKKKKDKQGQNDALQDPVHSSGYRSVSLEVCKKAGFKPASSLPTNFERELRPAIEIAGRLIAIKALVLWLMIPEENLSTEDLQNFVMKNGLVGFMSEDEKTILESSRDDEELRNAIGWKFENAWPLAWYFGYQTPDISGQMMSGEQMQEILMNHSCPLDTSLNDWTNVQETVSSEAVEEKEDLFYCAHNAVRSAQMGGDTVPENFDPMGNGGVIHERRHSLTWMLQKGVDWDDTDLST